MSKNVLDVSVKSISSSSSTQNNANTNATRISNINVNNQNLQGSVLQVGNIRLDTMSMYINGSYSQYGDAVVSAGVIVPFGNGRARKAANTIAYNESLASRGSLCMSVHKNRMTEQMVKATFGAKEAAWLKDCIDTSTKEIAVTERVPQGDLDDARRERQELLQQIQELRDQLNARRLAPVVPPTPPKLIPPASQPVPGLW